MAVLPPSFPTLGPAGLHHDRAETTSWARHWCAEAAEVERRRRRAWAKAWPRLGFILHGLGASGRFGNAWNALLALPSGRSQKQAARLPASSAAAPARVPLALQLPPPSPRPPARLRLGLNAGGVARWPPPFSPPVAPSPRPSGPSHRSARSPVPSPCM